MGDLQQPAPSAITGPVDDSFAYLPLISSAPDERWDNAELRELRQLTGSDFEALDLSALMIDADSGQAQIP